MSGGRSAPLLVFLLLATISGSLAVRAALRPPADHTFVGTFYYVDDFYNYLSYVEQAARGELVFRNKLLDRGLPPSLVNLEWLTVGWISAVLGQRPLVAYRVFGFAALLVLVLGIDLWLARCSLPDDRRLAGLLLVTTGGGLGGLLYATGWLPGERAIDLRTGIFPFVEQLANPHFVAGTALLLAALHAFAEGRGARAAALGTVLGLVRPYDAGLLAGIEGLAVLLTAPPREWPRRLLPVAGLGPVLGYNAWLLLASPGARNVVAPYGAVAPSAADVALALAPAVLLSLLALRRGAGERSGHRLRLLLWAALALSIVLLRPVSFALQFGVGLGVPLLVLAAVGLSRQPRGVLETSVALMATTAVVATGLALTPSSRSHAPSERFGVATALSPRCRPGELVLAPADIGLFVGGLTACWPFLAHGAAPGHDERSAEVLGFYDPATPTACREERLAALCPEYVVVPAGAPPGWLGTAPPYRFLLRVSSRRAALDLWRREGATCPRPSSGPC
jgi:hypothetical protein